MMGLLNHDPGLGNLSNHGAQGIEVIEDHAHKLARVAAEHHLMLQRHHHQVKELWVVKVKRSDEGRMGVEKWKQMIDKNRRKFIFF